MSEKMMPSPEEVAKIEKERTISDAELLRGGAEYIINERGEKLLEPTKEQIERINSEESLNKLKKIIEEQDIREGDSIILEVVDGSVGFNTEFVRLTKNSLVFKELRPEGNPFSYYRGLDELVEFTITDLSKIKKIEKIDRSKPSGSPHGAP